MGKILSRDEIYAIFQNKVDDFYALKNTKDPLYEKVSFLNNLLKITSTLDLLDQNIGGVEVFCELTYGKNSPKYKKYVNAFWNLYVANKNPKMLEEDLKRIYDDTFLLRDLIVNDREEIYAEIKEISEKLQASYDENVANKRVLAAIKFKGFIPEYLLDHFYNTLKSIGLTEREIILCSEEVVLDGLKSKNRNNIEKTRITELLTFEHEKLPISYEDTLDYSGASENLFNYYCPSFRHISVSEIKDFSKELPFAAENEYECHVYDCFYKKMINFWIEEIETLKSELNIESYKNIDDKNLIIEDYKEKKIKLEFLESIHAKAKEQLSKFTKEELDTEDKAPQRILAFLPAGYDSTYLERDLKFIPEHCYQEVKNLLEDYEYDNSAQRNFSSLGTNNKILKGFWELRDDQIRILFYHLMDNIYMIVGAFQKKSDNDIERYHTLASRVNLSEYMDESLANDIIASAPQIKERIYSFLDTNARKANR